MSSIRSAGRCHVLQSVLGSPRLLYEFLKFIFKIYMRRGSLCATKLMVFDKCSVLRAYGLFDPCICICMPLRRRPKRFGRSKKSCTFFARSRRPSPEPLPPWSPLCHFHPLSLPECPGLAATRVPVQAGFLH